LSRIIDLTIPLSSGVGHPMFRKVHLAPYHVHEIHRRSNADLSLAIHTATHIDAPYHFIPQGTRIDGLPLDFFIGEGFLFKLEPLAQARHQFTVAELKAAAKGKVGDLNGKIAVVSTGWSNRAFSDEPRYFRESPTLSPEAARWLAEAKIKAVVLDSATDAYDPAPVQEQPCPVHRTFLEHSIPIVENCTDVVKIPAGQPFTLYAIPLKIQGESGAPARVFARIEEKI
jgi:arylformamidase